MRTSSVVLLSLNSLLSVSLLLACGDEASKAGTPLGGGNSPNSGGTVNTGGNSNPSGGATSQGGASGGASSGGTTSGGTGGTTTSGGAGGATTGGAGGNATGGGGGGVNPATVLFSENFDAVADNMIPSGWNTFIGYNVPGQNTPGSDTFVLVDGSSPMGRSGKALHVKASSNPAVLTHPIPPGTTSLYLRSYIWSTQQIGDLGASSSNNHDTMISLRGKPGMVEPEIRLGNAKGAFGFNAAGNSEGGSLSDALFPAQPGWNKGPSLAAKTWHCVETAFVINGADHQVIAWANGTEIRRINSAADWDRTVAAEYLKGMFSEVTLGWHTFSNLGNELWFDDVVVATERVGCN